jgi:hypothetical protein
MMKKMAMMAILLTTACSFDLGSLQGGLLETDAGVNGIDSQPGVIAIDSSGSIANPDTIQISPPDSGVIPNSDTSPIQSDSGSGLATDTDPSDGTGCVYSSSSHVLPSCYSLDWQSCPAADGCYWVGSTSAAIPGYCGGSRVPCNQSPQNKCSNGCVFAYACSGTMPPCGQLADEQTCVNNNCAWSGGCGGGATRTGCAQNSDKVVCQNYLGCIWSPIPLSPCIGTRTPCSQILNRQACEGSSCIWSTSLGCWYDAALPQCDYIQDQTSCQAIPGCSWGG